MPYESMPMPSAPPAPYSETEPLVPWGFDYARVKSNNAVNYDSFTGDIEFTVNASESERWISTKNSYLSIRLRVVQSDEAGTLGTLAPIVNTGNSKATATLLSIPYIAPNPAACLFTAVSCDIGKENISNNQNIGPINTLYRTLYESKQEEETVNATNPIKYMTQMDTFTTANKSAVMSDYFKNAPNTGYPDTLTNFSNHKLFALQNMNNYNMFQEVEINTQLMAPFFYSDDLIPPNTPFTLRFTADNNYHTNLIQIAGSNVCSLPTGGAVNYTISKLSNASVFTSTNVNGYNTIGVGVIDMNLWLYRVHMPDCVSRIKEIYVKQYTSTLHALTSGTHDEFNIDFKKNRRVTHMAMAFVQKKSQLKTTQTDFSSGFYIGAAGAGGVDVPAPTATTEAIVYSNSPIAQLSNVRIEYAGTVYPFQPYAYNFDYTTYNTNSPFLSNSTYRAYYDFCNFSDGLRDRNGVLLNSSQYMIAPIILFKTYQNPNNDHNTCLVSIDFKNSVSGANVIVVDRGVNEWGLIA